MSSLDILVDILKYINYKKVMFMLDSLNKNELIYLIHFEELVRYDEIKDLSFSDNFNNIILELNDKNIPI